MVSFQSLSIQLIAFLAVSIGLSSGPPTTLASTAFAENGGNPPSVMPDRIILTFAGDPSASQAITWRTDTTVTNPVVQITVATPGPNLEKNARTLTAETVLLRTPQYPVFHHSLNMTDLQPSTLYAYRVGDGKNWSEWFQFKTASDRAEPFSFIYLGDAQNEIRSLWSRAIRAAYSDAPKARFIIHAGDLIDHANSDGEWGEWFNAGSWLNAMVPSIPSPGNHEYESTLLGLGKQLSINWRPQFTLPENGPAGLEETAYFLDYQGVRIVSLNSNERIAEQAVWLDQMLKDNPSRWTCITFHHPVFSTAKGRDNKELRETWMPVFDKHRVDLVLQGHDHTYGRTKNVRSGVSVRNDQSGTVYVVSVSGPKMYAASDSPLIARMAEDTQLYQIIYVSLDTLRYEAKTVTGELYDAFELIKQPSGVNLLVERAPQGNTRRRVTGSN
jgi:hypothetical protein